MLSRRSLLAALALLPVVGPRLLAHPPASPWRTVLDLARRHGTETSASHIACGGSIEALVLHHGPARGKLAAYALDLNQRVWVRLAETATKHLTVLTSPGQQIHWTYDTVDRPIAGIQIREVA